MKGREKASDVFCVWRRRRRDKDKDRVKSDTDKKDTRKGRGEKVK